MIIAAQIASELAVKAHQVEATINLLDQGDTVPFIARYRKEVTGALDDIQLRKLFERLGYLRQLQQRRETVILSITDQGKMTPSLKKMIGDTLSKTELEDLYLPFKPKRQSKAQSAINAGLLPLADQLLTAKSAKPNQLAAPFIQPDKEISTREQALTGAENILIERFAENAQLLGKLRHWMSRNGQMEVQVKRGKNDENSKFRDYFDYSEAINKIPAHRALAIFRGVQQGILKTKIKPTEYDTDYPLQCIERFFLGHSPQGELARWLKQAALNCWQQKLLPSIASDLSRELHEKADLDSIEVFAKNLSDLLMAAPAGQKVTLGLDPGLRTGVKVAIVSQTGALLAQDTLYPHAPRNQWDTSIERLAVLSKQYRVELISIGNGTASRETEQLVKDLQKRYPDLSLTSVMVSEAGASVYSASEQASLEFADVDVSIRGGISIARRLQDPLAELVKIEPKAIGVGQYQHDVNQKALTHKLDIVVEDCVNRVGVNLNSASVQLLTKVSGINESIAKNIVAMRDQKGAFKDRKSLLNVPRLGAKAFQQAAGFLRVDNPKQPLDNSAVHPESYPLVEQMAAHLNTTSAQLIGNATLLNRLAKESFTTEHFGQYTIDDTLQELAKPGRDPRPEFKTATFAADINSLDDLSPDLSLQGVITNVTNFGAFVDIGVHQDGLVHISELADQFVKDPHQIVHTGQIVQVRVLSVDPQRKRVSLSMKS